MEVGGARPLALRSLHRLPAQLEHDEDDDETEANLGWRWVEGRGCTFIRVDIKIWIIRRGSFSVPHPCLIVS